MEADANHSEIRCDIVQGRSRMRAGFRCGRGRMRACFIGRSDSVRGQRRARMNACAVRCVRREQRRSEAGSEAAFRVRRDSVRVCSGYVAAKNACGSNACAIFARRCRQRRLWAHAATAKSLQNEGSGLMSSAHEAADASLPVPAAFS